MNILLVSLLFFGVNSIFSLPIILNSSRGVSAPEAAILKVRREVPENAYSLPFAPLSSSFSRNVLNIKQNQVNDGNGIFNYSFESEDGIAVKAKGYLKNIGTDEEAQVMQGEYSYTAPDGTPIVTRWFADETGFHAEGAHIPGQA